MTRYAILETIGTRKSVRDHFATFAEAVASAHATYAIAFFDEDEDHPGEAADFMTKTGQIYAIEAV